MKTLTIKVDLDDILWTADKQKWNEAVEIKRITRVRSR
jgi:hypothetical protein